MSRSVFLLFVSLIAAAVPPALAIGPGAEARIPMAIAVIGGVTTWPLSHLQHLQQST